MRTDFEIDDELMRSAMEASGRKTEEETVVEALRMMVRAGPKSKLLDELRKLGPWEGNLDEMRRDKPELRGDW